MQSGLTGRGLLPRTGLLLFVPQVFVRVQDFGRSDDGGTTGDDAMIRGLQRLEPLFMRPPCGIRTDLDRDGGSRARTAHDYIMAGATAAELSDAGFTARELALAHVSAVELRALGFFPSVIASTKKYSPAELRQAGCSVLDLLGNGVPAHKLVAAGYDAADLARAGIGAAVVQDLIRRGTPTPTPTGAARPRTPRLRTQSAAGRARSMPSREGTRPATAPALRAGGGPPAAQPPHPAFRGTLPRTSLARC